MKNLLHKLHDSKKNEEQFYDENIMRQENGKKPLKQRKELKCEVSCLKFDSSSIHNAIVSIENLSMSTGDKYKTHIVEYLRKCYVYLRDSIIEDIDKIEFD